MTFEEWWDKFTLTEINGNIGYNARKIWEAAQKTERERIVTVIYDNPELFSEGGFAALLELVEINELEP